MSAFELELEGARSAFAPGEPIRGRASWSVEHEVESAEVRLFWYTEGKGEQDVGVVDSVSSEAPGRDDDLEFSFVAPPAPLSFSGKLISLVWAVELVVMPGSRAARREILLSDIGREIRLDPDSDPAAESA